MQDKLTCHFSFRDNAKIGNPSIEAKTVKKRYNVVVTLANIRSNFTRRRRATPPARAQIRVRYGPENCARAAWGGLPRGGDSFVGPAQPTSLEES